MYSYCELLILDVCHCEMKIQYYLVLSFNKDLTSNILFIQPLQTAFVCLKRLWKNVSLNIEIFFFLYFYMQDLRAVLLADIVFLKTPSQKEHKNV